MSYLLRFFALVARIATALFKPNREGHLTASDKGLYWVKGEPQSQAAAKPEPSPHLDFSKLEQASPEERKAAIEFLAQVAVHRVNGGEPPAGETTSASHS